MIIGLIQLVIVAFAISYNFMPKICYNLLVSPILILMTNTTHIVVFAFCTSIKYMGAVTVYILLASIFI